MPYPAVQAWSYGETCDFTASLDPRQIRLSKLGLKVPIQDHFYGQKMKYIFPFLTIAALKAKKVRYSLEWLGYPNELSNDYMLFKL
jgi:hypothetical protein